jgi:tetratricopeptide (TPR) repeat protein
MAGQPTASQLAAKVPPIRGWLLVLAMGMVGGPLLTALYIALWAFLGEGQVVLLLLALFAFQVYVARAFFRRSTAAPGLVIVLLLLPVIVNIACGGKFEDTVYSSIWAGMWIPYLWLSKRVKTTFIVGRTARTVVSPPQSSELPPAPHAGKPVAPATLRLNNAVMVFDPWTEPRPAPVQDHTSAPSLAGMQATVRAGSTPRLRHLVLFPVLIFGVFLAATVVAVKLRAPAANATIAVPLPATSVAASDREATASDYIKRGDAAFHKRKREEAINHYTEAIRLDPGNADAFRKRGRAFHYSARVRDPVTAEKEYDRAVADYDQAIRLNPNDAYSYDLRGDAWAGRKKYDRAIADYDRAIQLDAENAHYYIDRGNAWAENKEFDRAIRDFDHAVRLDPDYPYAYSSRADVRIEKKDYDGAIADLTEAVRLAGPEEREFLGFESSLASAYHKRGKDRLFNVNRGVRGPEDFKDANRKAIDDYNEAIRLYPNEAEYFISRGDARSFLGDYDSAIQDFDKAIRIDPNGYSAYSGRGSAWVGQCNYDKAIRDFNEALRLGANDPVLNALLYSARGGVWAAKKNYDRAIADYDLAIRLAPNSIADFYASRGDAWLAKRNYDQAIRDYDQAVRLDPIMAQRVDQNRRIAWSRRMAK